MRIRCKYCDTFISDTDEKCPNCGAVNSELKRVGNDVPTTIEELKKWYVDHNLPDEETTRFFIGKNYEGKKAFGIYFDEATKKYVVYKKRADGTRAIRYEGKDENYAVNELYIKLREEILNQKELNNFASVSPGEDIVVPETFKPKTIISFRLRLIISVVLAPIISALLCKIINFRSKDYMSSMFIIFAIVFFILINFVINIIINKKQKLTTVRIIAITFIISIIPLAILLDNYGIKSGYYYVDNNYYYKDSTSWYIYNNDDWIESKKPKTDHINEHYKGFEYKNDYSCESYRNNNTNTNNNLDDSNYESSTNNNSNRNSGSDWDSDW